MGDNPMLEAALEYVAQGFKVFPLCWPTPDGQCGCSRNHPKRYIGKVPLTQHGLKDATQTQSGVKEYWGRWPKACIGLVTAGLIVLDFDIGHGGLESKADLEAISGPLPRTRTHRTGGGGEHWLYRAPNGANIRNTVALGGYQGVDLRGTGGYIVAPPSSHVSGKNYEVIDDSEIALAPEWLIELASQRTPTPQTTTTGEAVPIPEGQRNAHLASLAGSMRRRGMPYDAIKAALLEVNTAQCQPPLPDTEVRKIAESIAQYPSAEAAPRANNGQTDARLTDTDARAFNLTDLGNAERLIKYYGDRLRYCYERKRWLVWNSKAWEWDSGAKITALAKLGVRNIYHEAGNEPDEKKRKELADHAKRSESDHKINAMINLAQSEQGVPIKVSELDTNPWLFNCLNGTLDLKTGQLLPHHKEDMLTILVPTEYHPNAQCPRWLSFLNQVTGSNAKLVDYLQRTVGYTLTGDIKSQVLFFLYGLGNNGKSTFAVTIRKLMGEYGERVTTDLFMLKDRNAGGPKEALANLKGKRYVVASELEDSRRLAVGLIKDMTGGETIKADRKYEHEVEYQPTHKLWLIGNHRPVIADTTLSIWRRLKLVPFTVTIPDKEIDLDLPSKLEAELPGILAWAVKGCLAWQQHGLNEPATVSDATASYRHEQDILGDFIEDCCILEPLISIPKSDLINEYHRWCEANSVEPVTRRTFRIRLIERGISDGRIGKARLWKGIRLRTDEDGALDDEIDAKGDKTSDILASEVTKGNQKPGTSTRKESQEKLLAQTVTNVTKKDIAPPYPTEPCQCGCGDYWLTDDNRWLCSRCHPKPGGDHCHREVKR